MTQGLDTRFRCELIPDHIWPSGVRPSQERIDKIIAFLNVKIPPQHDWQQLDRLLRRGDYQSVAPIEPSPWPIIPPEDLETS